MQIVIFNFYFDNTNKILYNTYLYVIYGKIIQLISMCVYVFMCMYKHGFLPLGIRMHINSKHLVNIFL